MDKRILICLLVLVIISVVILLLTRPKEPEKHVHFEEPATPPTDSLPSISPAELELAQDQPETEQPAAKDSEETFQMPHFNVCGGTLNRSKNEKEIAKTQPKFNSFGVSRGMAVGESELEAETFEENSFGAFRRRGNSGPEKVQPRVTLAMRMMDKADIEKMLSTSNAESTAASTTVLNKIDDVKEAMKPKKKSKSR